MPDQGAIRIQSTETCAGAGLATLRTDPVPPGEAYWLQRVSYEGSLATSGGNTRARVYVDGHGPKLYVHETKTPTADILYTITDPLIITAGERLALEWDQAQAGTILKLVALGSRMAEEAATSL